MILAGYAPKAPALLHLGTWVLDQALALQRLGYQVAVISPTPWVPRGAGLVSKLARWRAVQKRACIQGIAFAYPRWPVPPQVARLRLFYLLPNNWPKVLGPSVWRTLAQHAPDVILAHHPLWEGELARQFKAKEGVPFVTVEHSWTDLKRAVDNPRARRWYVRVLAEADWWFAVNRRMAEEMMRLQGVGWVTSDDIEDHVLRPGGSALLEKSDRSQPTRLCLGTTLRVLSVGWLGERKGHAVLIRAIKELVDRGVPCTLTIVGEGSLRPTLENLVRQLGLHDHVRLVGSRSHAEVLRMMSEEADVFALLSWDEPLGVAYLEAMSVGLPIVGTAGEGIAEVITDGEEGFLVPRGDARGAADALHKLVDPVVRHKMGKKAKETASRLTWEANARRLEEVFERILSRSKSRRGG